MANIDVFKLTNDDWYPSYKLTNGESLVCVSFTKTGPNPPIDGEWRVCIWGDDDCGMEKYFLGESEAFLTFVIILGWEFVDRDLLTAIGFKSA